ncbi:MAG: type III pantothenate kinase [Anaeroplasmataceae bacterium]
MILLIDIGNSNILLGLYDGVSICNTFRVKSFTDKTSDEYRILFDEILSKTKLDDIIICSVVPVITSSITKMIKNHYKITPKVVGDNLKTGIMLKADDPKSVGADLVCGCAGAMINYNEALIIDLGTATKYIYVKDNQLLGVSIAPGVAISMKALVTNTALLPSIELQAPKSVLCRNTISCMQSGIIYGSASQVDGMIDRIKEELNKDDLTIITTGGLSNLITPLCKHNLILDDNLVLKGLLSIYLKNTINKD